MKKIFLFSITLFSVLIFFSCKTENSKSKAKSITSSSEIEISKTELLNKIKGGWAGQVIGCTYGGPTETVNLYKKQLYFKIISSNITSCFTTHKSNHA
jgi:hypothetical protein